MWPRTDPTQTHTPGSSFVASHRQRRRSKGAPPWQISLKPRSAFLPVSPLSLGTDLGVHAHLLKRPVIAHSLEPSGREAFHRYFWHTLSLNHTRQRGDYSLLSPCLSELGSGWQEMDVSNRWAVPFRKESRGWGSEGCLIKNEMFWGFLWQKIMHTSVQQQTEVGSDMTWPIIQVWLTGVRIHRRQHVGDYWEGGGVALHCSEDERQEFHL